MKQGIKQIVIIFAAALVLEVFLSNYTLLSCITKPHNQQADWSVYAADDGNEVCFIEEVGFEVQNIEIVYKDDADDFVKYVVTVNQEGSQYSDYSYPEKWDTMKKSTKFNLNCATPVNYIYIENAGSNIDSIVLNSMSFRINAYRLAFLILSFTAVLIVKKYMHVKSSMKLKTIMLTATVMSILLVSFSRLEYSKAIHVMEKPETEQMNLLVEAFSKGQVYFSWVPGEELLALENPYDYSEREAKGAFALFDGVYYNGYFCTCFGAAPVLVLMLPFYLLTGMYLSTMTANLIFMCMGLFLMGGLYYLLLKKFVRNISSTTYVVGYITFVVGSGFLSLLRGLMYDIAVTSAMDFIMIAILLLIVQEKKDKLKGGLLFLSGLSTGLAVLAKPNFIVYYLIILWLWYQLAHKYSIRECLLKSSYFLIPLMLCAVFQLTYNYARFGNFLEFGYNYQTGADPKIIHNSSCAAVIKGVITYLVSFPKLNIGEFPFLTMSTSVTGTGMNVVTAADKCLGLIFVPIVYPLVFYKRRGHSLKAQGDKNIEKLDVIIKISIVICMMQLFISARYASGNDEYLIDIRALLILLSITLSVLCVNTITDFKIEFLCILTIMIMLPVSLGRGVNLRYPTELNLIAKNVFEWWS